MDTRPIWESVFGTVERGEKFTIFSLSVRLNNGLLITSMIHATNEELEMYHRCYQYILDEMTKKLDERISERV